MTDTGKPDPLDDARLNALEKWLREDRIVRDLLHGQSTPEAADTIAALRERVEQQDDTLQEIRNWAEAYPLSVFGEPSMRNLTP